MLVGGLALEHRAPPFHVLPVYHDGRGGFDLDLVVVHDPVGGDLQVELSHSRQKVLAGLVVDLDLDGRIGLGDGPEDIDQLGQVLHVLGLNGHGDHGLGVVGDLLERFHVLIGADGGTGHSVL